MKFSIRNPFKRKTDPRVEEVIDAKIKSMRNKNAMADRIVKAMDGLKRTERRCGILDPYVGPERRHASA